MALITIDSIACNRDGVCVEACPLGLLEQQKGSVPLEISGAEDLCIRCGHCVAVCPTSALANKLMPLEDFRPVPEGRPEAEQMEALLLGRRSVRSFRRTTVPQENLECLIEVARCAPTASNSQNVAWVIIRDAARLERIRSLTVEWLSNSPRRAVYTRMAERGSDVVLRGGTVLAVAYAPEEYLWNDVDCAIALTYMELHAVSLGLGACWGGLVTSASKAVPALHKALGVPKGQQVGGALMLGLPRRKHRLVPPRKPATVAWL